MVIIPYATKQHLYFSEVKAMELSFVGLLVFIYGIGEQYFLLPIIWGSIFASRWYWAYTAVATVFLVGSPNNIDLPYILALWNTIWAVVTGWLLSYALVVKPSLHRSTALRTSRGGQSL